MALTDLVVRQAKPKEKRYSLSDGRGLILEVRPNGSKFWVARFWSKGKERRRHLGRWPDVSVKDARALAAASRADGDAQGGASTRLRDVADEWMRVRMANKSASYLRGVRLRLDRYVLPELGDMALGDITSGVVLRLCRAIEARGTIETASRVKVLVGQLFRYAIATDRAESDPTAALAGALQTRKPKHMATVTDPAGIALLMRSIRAYPHAVVRCAMELSALTFCRPGEIRHAEWAEVDLDRAEWRIPAAKMKMGRPHIVPLARQTVALLRGLHELTGRGRWLFPSARGDGRPMSENAVRVALRSMGYGNDDMTPHGFRAMASTRLNEMGWRADVIERQLAHAERNAVRAAYDHSDRLDERRRMMQAWADFL
ncbi:MAG: tyrosine-type recombinase/integrase, partial [Synergistaceae bacterium]|nr:tyrosine-type recombinase/integrase [Synergistaceae bacterium]